MTTPSLDSLTIFYAPHEKQAGKFFSNFIFPRGENASESEKLQVHDSPYAARFCIFFVFSIEVVG
jgi:hypothetical protein